MVHIEAQQRLSRNDVLANLHVRRETLSTKGNRIYPDMNEKFRAVTCPQVYRVAARRHGENNGIEWSAYNAVGRIDGYAITEHPATRR
jgi:hypothetical protein